MQNQRHCRFKGKIWKTVKSHFRMKLTLEQATTTENIFLFRKCTLFLCQLLIIQPLSILCRSLRDIDTYTTGFPLGTNQGQANIFRAVKRILPGPVRISASSQWTTVLYFTNNLPIYSMFSTPLFYLRPRNCPSSASSMGHLLDMRKGGRLVFECQMIPYVKQYCKIWKNR
jgi:hypothetical protein